MLKMDTFPSSTEGIFGKVLLMSRARTPHNGFSSRPGTYCTKPEIRLPNALQHKGKHPKDIPSRSQTISKHKIDIWAATESEIITNRNVISHHYRPSVASFNYLKKMMFRDLALETHHRGFYLLIRFVSEAIRTSTSAVVNIAEDETGTVLRLALYFQLPEHVRSARSILRSQAVIILKEPYFRAVTDGEYEICVDHPTDIIWLLKDDTRIPAAWRVRDMESVDDWKQKGNDQVRKNNFFEAIEMYTTALGSSPTPEEQEIIHENKALANLKVGAFDAALDDASFVKNPQDRSEKGLYRGALALYGLRRYAEALELLEILVKKHPDNEEGNLKLGQCQLRLAEAETGQYDFSALYEATKLRPPLMDNASYIGPVEVRGLAGRGRELFTTKPVKAGDMLLCEKALVYSFSTPPGEMTTAVDKEMSVLFDLNCGRIHIGSQTNLVRDLVNKLILNPSLIPSFEHLYHGDSENYQYITNASIDDTKVLDTFLVAKTTYLNSFGCHLTSRNDVSTPELDKASGYTTIKEHSVDTGLLTTGIWTWTFLINHACDPNSMRSFIGDLLIIRATRDMPAMTELSNCYITPENPTLMNEKLLIGWGFQCTCALCVDDRETSNVTKANRKRLIQAFNADNFSINVKREILEQIQATYQNPPTKIPRIDMMKLHDSLACDTWMQAETAAHYEQAHYESVIEELLACLETLGFIIEGARISSTVNPQIVVQKWGYACWGNCSRWLSLRRCYKMIGQMQLAEQAERFARICWMIFVGEDTTFVVWLKDE